MENIVVKTEMQSNGEILLFYVDENGDPESGMVTTVGNINHGIQFREDPNAFVIEEVDVNLPHINTTGDIEFTQTQQYTLKERWTDDDVKKLLTFYIDNRQNFLAGVTKKKHLWTIACKTMLMDKSPSSCEIKLKNLKTKYAQLRADSVRGIENTWIYLDLCHQAFHDDKYVKTLVDEACIQTQKQMTKIPVFSNQNEEGIVVVKKVINPRSSGDETVETMLKLYLKHAKRYQNEYRRKELWQTIAMELGEDDSEYWHKRFLNFKQHYISMLEKRESEGPQSINWPYMHIFDEIFKEDKDFQIKYMGAKVKKEEPLVNSINNEQVDLWNIAELTILAKYCFDSFDEFQDPTIPNNFLWTEIGRFLNFTPEACKLKYAELKTAHLDKYINGGYDIRTRIPIDIIFDNIISKEMELVLSKPDKNASNADVKSEIVDDLVQFFFDNIEMFKDPICYFVCWPAVAKKFNKSIETCKTQWDELVRLYKSILDDKKENPDMQISWKYIELFDRIFDYGMDMNLLEGYEKQKKLNENTSTDKIAVKKVNISFDENLDENASDDDESFDERGFMKRSKRRSGESRAIKILEYYIKNKEKFMSNPTNKHKHSLWTVLSNQIGISATQCAHRFRNLKQVYKSYVQKEISKPEKPILWPYYALCKKAFGYRAIKSKLKNGKPDSDDSEEWSPKEIKQVINYFSQRLDEVDNNTEFNGRWADLAADIGKSEYTCYEKFLELRKSYRKLKTMRTRNPDVKISWKYFNMFENIYSSSDDIEQQSMEVDQSMDSENRNEHDEDGYQCIIVIPEGLELSDIENSQIIIQAPEDNVETQVIKPLFKKWTKRTKKLLLIYYINYIRSHRKKEIIPKEMWKEIALKLNKTPLACRKMFAKLKNNHKPSDDLNKKKTPYYALLEKLALLKPNFVKTEKGSSSLKERIYKDVSLPDEKVELALKYYLSNIEDFVSPKFDKKYLWTELSQFVSEPVRSVFNKINYLKQNYNLETDEIAGQRTPFGDLLKDILAKEIAIKLVIDNEPKPSFNEDEIDIPWTDEETELLLEWYLGNLDKFKSPKFVRRYLWLEASAVLKKSPLMCSKKMSEIRTQYRNMVRETPDQLNYWRFHELCQKIYGTGKKVSVDESAELREEKQEFLSQGDLQGF